MAWICSLYLSRVVGYYLNFFFFLGEEEGSMCICLYSDLFKLPGNHSIEEPTAGWMLNCSFRRQHVPLLLSSQAHSYLPCQARLPESSFPWSLSYTITFGRREINVFSLCLNILYSSGNLCPFSYVGAVHVALHLGVQA